MATILTPKDRQLEPYPGTSDGLLMQYLSPDDPYVHWLQVNNIHLREDPTWRLG